MMERTECAYAKLNLSLDVVGLLESGYHALESLMQSVSLTDTVQLRAQPGEGVITAQADWGFLPTGEKNLAGKAAAVFLRETGITGWDVSVKLAKRIPACAGMGGGSSDAAAVLRGLDALFKTNLGWRRLSEIGAAVGSDVPFCVLGGTALAEGRGEILTPLRDMPHGWVTLCKPGFPVSTPEMFRRIDGMKTRVRPDTPGLLKAVEDGSLTGIARRMYNVFEDALTQGREEVRAIRDTLIDAGALGSVMTGSGPTVLGLFNGRKNAMEAAERLKSRYRDTFLAQTCSNSDPMD